MATEPPQGFYAAIPPEDNDREVLKYAADFRVTAEIVDIRLPEDFDYEEERPTCLLIVELLEVRRSKAALDPGEVVSISYGCFQSMLMVLNGDLTQPVQIWMVGDRGGFEAVVVESPSADEQLEEDLKGIFPSVKRGTPMSELDLDEHYDYRPGKVSRLGAYLGRLSFNAPSRRDFGAITAGGGGVGSPAWRVTVFDDGRAVLRQADGLDRPINGQLDVVQEGVLAAEELDLVLALASRLHDPQDGIRHMPQTVISFQRVEYLFLTQDGREVDYSPPGPVADGLPGTLHRYLKSMLWRPKAAPGPGGGQLLDAGSTNERYRPLMPHWGLLAGGGGLLSPSWRVVLDFDSAVLSWARSEEPGALVFGDLPAAGQRTLTARERRRAVALAGEILDPARAPAAQNVRSGDALGVLILTDGIFDFELMPPGPIINGKEAELHQLLRSLAWPEP